MKKFILLSAVLTGIIFFGCSKDTQLVDPVNTSGKTEHSLISLPTPSGLVSEVQNIFSFNVNGWEGAYQTMYLNFQGTNATVSADYTFPKDVFSGQKTITITFNNDKASASYSPSPLDFNAPVTANITYTGLNLSGINASSVQFVYLPSDGHFDPIECERIEVNIATGMIKVVNAKLYSPCM